MGTVLTAKQIRDLNRMNRAAQNITLGTLLSSLKAKAGVTGSHIVTEVEANGSAVDIATGETGITWFDVEYYRSGSSITAFNVVNSGSNLYIAPTTDGSLVITGSDVINWEIIGD